MIVGLALTACSTKLQTIPAELAGSWVTPKTKITVRTFNKDKYNFTQDSAIVKLNFNNNNTINGFIGNAPINNATIWLNSKILPSSVTGVKYILTCDKIGKIYDLDPINSKEIEIWISPIDTELKTFEAELRYTEKLAVFPMAGLKFSPKN